MADPSPSSTAGQPIRWRGRPVPWVTGWTGEQADSGQNMMRIIDGRLWYRTESLTDRDSRGA